MKTALCVTMHGIYSIGAFQGVLLAISLKLNTEALNRFYAPMPVYFYYEFASCLY